MATLTNGLEAEPFQQYSEHDVERYLDILFALTGESIDKEVVMKYLKQVKESEGFDIKDFPGVIEGITYVYPCQYVIDNREYDPEAYDKIMDMAAMAIATYNKQSKGTKFKVVEIEKVNRESYKVDNYHITFVAVNVKGCKPEKQGRDRLLANHLETTVTCAKAAAVTVLASVTGIFAPSSTARLSLSDKKLKLKSCQHLKASNHELCDEAAIRKTFQAVVMEDLIEVKRKVLFCRLKM